MEYLDAVSEQDQVVGRVSFKAAHEKGILHRTSNVLIFDSTDLLNLLINQRSSRAETAPLKYQFSAGGHVLSGETYEQGALREMNDELFKDLELPNISLTHVATYRNVGRPTNPEFAALHYCVYNGSFSPNPEEVESVHWDNIYEVEKMIEETPERYTKAFAFGMGIFSDAMKTRIPPSQQ
jgi:isopentenyldiphosphate isomerase